MNIIYKILKVIKWYLWNNLWCLLIMIKYLSNVEKNKKFIYDKFINSIGDNEWINICDDWFIFWIRGFCMIEFRIFN